MKVVDVRPVGPPQKVLAYIEGPIRNSRYGTLSFDVVLYNTGAVVYVEEVWLQREGQDIAQVSVAYNELRIADAAGLGIFAAPASGADPFDEWPPPGRKRDRALQIPCLLSEQELARGHASAYVGGTDTDGDWTVRAQCEENHETETEPEP